MREPLASRVLFPLTERRFTYGEYGRFLDRVAGHAVVPLRAFARGEGEVALRHDVDSRLESALEFAALEAERSLRATYFVLHTAPYWSDPDLLPRLRRLQELGHEVGFHNDLVTLERVHRVDVGEYAPRELERLRAAGLEIVGTSAHGSPWCHKLGYHNNYVFAGWDEPVPGFPSTQVRVKLDPAELGLEYEAYHVRSDLYASDATFAHGRRWHPEQLRLEPGLRTVVLTHPCHWDRSATAKVRRLLDRVARRRAGALAGPRR